LPSVRTPTRPDHRRLALASRTRALCPHWPGDQPP
jgi:hypothetical protein